MSEDGGRDAALGCPGLGGMEGIVFHESSLEPLLQNSLVHRDVSQKPVMGDFIET